MTVIVLAGAEADLTDAYDHHEAARPGLGEEFLVEFRRGVTTVMQMNQRPDRWRRG